MWLIKVIVILAVIYAYTTIRLAQWLTEKPVVKRISLVTGLLLFCILFLMAGVRHAPETNLQIAVRVWTGYLTLGFVTLLFTHLLMIDTVWGLGRVSKWIVIRFKRKKHHRDESCNRERRAFVKTTVGYGVLGVTAGLTGVGFYEAVKDPIVKNVRVPIKNLPERFHGFTIAQLSDIHTGITITGSFVKRVVAITNELEPDLVAITGDLVDGSVQRLERDVSPLKALNARFGTFFVTGNHEYYSGAEQWVNHLKTIGISVLINEHTVIEDFGEQLVIAGVTDARAGHRLPGHKSDPAKALKGAPASSPVILLAHQPKTLYDINGLNVDLMLAGHTHGGQYYPWEFLVKLIHPYAHGLHTHSSGTRVYVTRGTGYWGPPLRLRSPSEIVRIELVPEAMA